MNRKMKNVVVNEEEKMTWFPILITMLFLFNMNPESLYDNINDESGSLLLCHACIIKTNKTQPKLN